MEDIKIIIDTNASEAGRSFDDLSKKFKNADNGAKDLRKEIKELKNELFKLTPGTKEYAQVLQELGGKMDQLQDTTQELRVATGGLDTVFESTTKATASLASGFTAAAGIVTLFGGDAEDLTKTFVKLQAAMAIMNGLKEFASFFKLFDRATISVKAYANQLSLSTAENLAAAGGLSANTAALAANTAATGANATVTASNIAVQTNEAAAVAKSTEEIKKQYNSVISNSLVKAKASMIEEETLDLIKAKINMYKKLFPNMERQLVIEKATAEALAEMNAKYHVNIALEEDRIKVSEKDIIFQEAKLNATKRAKALKDAETQSMAANTVATKANTKATVENTAAVNSNASAFGKAFPVFGMFKERLVAISTALKAVSATTWVVAGSITAIIGFMTHLWKEAKQVREQFEETDRVERLLIEDTDKLTRSNEQLEKSFTKLLEDYKRLGVSQQAIDKITYNHYANLKKQAKATYDSEIALAKFYATSKQTSEEWKKHNELAEEAVKLLKQYEGVLKDLDDIGVPAWMENLNDKQEKFAREIERAVNRGAMTEGQGIQKNLEKAKEELAEFNQLLDDWWSGDSERVVKANKRAFELGFALSETDNIEAQKSIFEARIKYYQEQLENYNDRMTKTMTQTMTANRKKSNEQLLKLTADFTKDFDKLYKEYYDRIEAFKSLTTDSDMTDPTAQARLYQWQKEFKETLDKMVTSQTEAAKKLGLTSKDFDTFVSSMKKRVSDFETYMANAEFPYPPELHERVSKMQQDMLKEAQTFVRLNENISKLVNEGKVSTQEYTEWLTDYISKYKETISKNSEQGQEIINEILETMTVSDEEKQKLAEFWGQLFNFSDEILPPSVAQSMEKTVTDMIDTMFDKIEERYEWRKDSFDLWMEDQNRSWLEGGDTKVWGNSTVQQYKDMQKQAEDLYNMLHAQYEEEKALLEEKMSLLDENSEAWQNYNDKLQKLRDADIQAEHDYDVAIVASRHQAIAAVMEDTQSLTESISGLASAMGSYYAEQAEQAKATYGEQSEEYKKYLKKEGNMKIAQVWTDFATGVMKTWAGYADFGPLTYVLAGIQTAALLATAIASTQQIRRETNATASGGQTNANVGQLTDRVIMAEAQNTDQTAQLNASYNQGATRVFVTVDDINSGQDANRTAVTNNRF